MFRTPSLGTGPSRGAPWFRQVRSLANVHCAAIVGARGDLPYDCVEDVWRRADVPRATIGRIAEADGYACLSEDRRQGSW